MSCYSQNASSSLKSYLLKIYCFEWNFFDEKLTFTQSSIHWTHKIACLLLTCLSKFPIIKRSGFSTFLMLETPWKLGQNTKIIPLLLIKLFEVQEWKWCYFLNLMSFWCWKSRPKNLNFAAPALDEFWLKRHGTKTKGVILVISIPCFIRFEI